MPTKEGLYKGQQSEGNISSSVALVFKVHSSILIFIHSPKLVQYNVQCKLDQDSVSALRGGPWASSIRSLWEPVGKAGSQVLPQVTESEFTLSEAYIVLRSPGVSHAPLSLGSTELANMSCPLHSSVCDRHHSIKGFFSLSGCLTSTLQVSERRHSCCKLPRLLWLP